MCFHRVCGYKKDPRTRGASASSSSKPPPTTMSGSKKKRGKPIIQQNIPANPLVTIKAHEFKRSTASRLVSTTSLSSSSRSPTPFVSQTAHEPSSCYADTQLYSNAEEELLKKAEKKAKGKPSRSVSVSTISPRFPHPSLT